MQRVAWQLEIPWKSNNTTENIMYFFYKRELFALLNRVLRKKRKNTFSLKLKVIQFELSISGCVRSKKCSVILENGQITLHYGKFRISSRSIKPLKINFQIMFLSILLQFHTVQSLVYAV